MKRSVWVSVVVLAVFAFCVVAAPVAAGEKIKVEKAEDLPKHTYEIDGKPSELLKTDGGLDALAEQVKKNTLDVLEKYEISDAKTLQNLYSALQQIYFFDGEYKTASEYLEKARELEDKEGSKHMMGAVSYSYVDALAAGEPGSEAFRTTLKENLAKRVAEMPWEAVEDLVQRMSGQMQIVSENLLVGMIQGQMDEAVEKAGHLSGDQANLLLRMRTTLALVIPYKDEITEVYGERVAAHKEEKKPDIWPDRNVAFNGDEGYSDVVVGIWDAGTDTEVFGKSNYVNASEKPDGEDNDGNGFVDDIHGIAFDLDAQPTTELLYGRSMIKGNLAELESQIKGFTDIQSAIESEEADALRKRMSTLEADEAKPFLEELNLYSHHAHGTHVAGIALEGNPYAKVLTARLTFDHHMTPKPYTEELIRATADSYKKTVAYFKQHGVRVVNMSWGLSAEEIEDNLEANGIGNDAGERAEMAREMFKVARDGLYEAMEGAADILFVAAAGNSDNDVEFDEFIPSGFDLPNVLIVGAVDQAGEATSFTSFGRTVSVYGNGFEVESYVPGGNRLAMSGTSMASPNVCNLAAKLLARDPSLSPEEVARLIETGADNMGDDEPMMVINPKRTMELLAERQHSSP